MKLVFKRIGAYILDTFLVMLVATLISSLTFINKDYKEYNSTYKEYNDRLTIYQNFIKDLENYYEDEEISEEEYENITTNYKEFSNYITSRYDDKKISNEEYDEVFKELSEIYTNEYVSYNYKLSKLNIISSIILIICLTLYFGVIQYLMKGQTLGKRIFNIKVINNREEKVGLVNLLIRTFILTGVLISIAQIICLFVLNETDYYKACYYIKIISSGIEFMILIIMLIRADGCGLHDLIARTKVVDINNQLKKECDNTIIEAQYIENNNLDNK